MRSLCSRVRPFRASSAEESPTLATRMRRPSTRATTEPEVPPCTQVQGQVRPLRFMRKPPVSLTVHPCPVRCCAKVCSMAAWASAKRVRSAVAASASTSCQRRDSQSCMKALTVMAASCPTSRPCPSSTPMTKLPLGSCFQMKQSSWFSDMPPMSVLKLSLTFTDMGACCCALNELQSAGGASGLQHTSGCCLLADGGMPNRLFIF
eukprot:2126-Heterococcus_DN1.PRE.3